VTTDPDHKFDLALSLDDLDTALEIVRIVPEHANGRHWAIGLLQYISSLQSLDKILHHQSLTTTPAAIEALELQKKYLEVSRDKMFDLINLFKCGSSLIISNICRLIYFSNFTAYRTPGRVDVLQALQASGKYDVA
jgi:nitroreductase